jgi:hypothetical protein
MTDNFTILPVRDVQGEMFCIPGANGKYGKGAWKKLMELPDSSKCLIFSWKYNPEISLSRNTYKIVENNLLVKVTL